MTDGASDLATNYQEILARLRALQDASGPRPPVIPLIDPTANVLSLVAAAITRQDDLRRAEAKRVDDMRIQEQEQQIVVAELREKLSNAELKRIDALNLAEARRLDAVNAETKAAVTLASERAATTAATLAATLAATTTQSNDRMARIEQQLYQTGGRDIQRDVGKVDVARYVGWFLAVAALLWSVLKPR